MLCQTRGRWAVLARPRADGAAASAGSGSLCLAGSEACCSLLLRAQEEESLYEERKEQEKKIMDISRAIAEVSRLQGLLPSPSIAREARGERA